MRRPAEPCHIARYCRSLRCLCGSPPAGTPRMIRSILPAACGIAIMRLPQWAFQACSHYFQAVVVPGCRGRSPVHYPAGLAAGGARNRPRSCGQGPCGSLPHAGRRGGSARPGIPRRANLSGPLPQPVDGGALHRAMAGSRGSIGLCLYPRACRPLALPLALLPPFPVALPGGGQARINGILPAARRK